MNNNKPVVIKQLVKETNRRVVSHRDYSGVCHACNSPVAFDGEIISVEVEDTKDYWQVVPIDTYRCPYCGECVIRMLIYKSLEVSKELVKHG